jgi:HEAT repeat protein
MTRDLRRALEGGTLDAAAALEKLKPIAQGANVRAVRVEAYGLIGEIAGRAFDATWEVAERAAWVLLNVARHAEVLAEKRGLLLAMGRGFRNLWLMPYVHARLDDARPEVVEAAIGAAGGLGFAALEEVVAARFLGPDVAPHLRRAAIDALGRMGAISSGPRLVPLVSEGGDDAVAALTALTEMRSPLGTAETAALIDREPPREVMMAAVRYLGEMGSMALPPLLRRLGRSDDPELRALASLAARAFKAERDRDAGDRILIALGEKDRAVRALLARRLRTLPIEQVLEQAEMLLGDYPEGIVQILGELRDREVTHFLLKVSARTDLPEQVASRAIGAIVADEKWELEALVKVIGESKDERVRAAAAQAMGSFATLEEVLERMGPLGSDPSPLLRGALVWAMQLAARPATLSKAVEKRCEDELRRGLGDADVVVRRRSAYVAGNLRLSKLAPDLVELAKREEKLADLRVAAYSGLGELAAPTVLNELVTLFRREEEPAALVAVSRAVVATAERNPDAKIDFARLQGRIVHLLGSADPAVRQAGVSLAGLARGAVPASALVPLAAAQKDAPHVREAALLALGRIGGAEAEALLVKALEDPDSAIQELAAEALLSLGGRRPLEQLLSYVSGEEDGAVRAGIASRLTIPDVEGAHFRPLVNAAIGRLASSDRAYEPLLALKIKLLEQQAGGSAPASGAAFDAAIVAVFPTYAKLSTVRGFEPLNRSLRTAESLYRSSGQLAEADHSSPIMLWMKCLEGYVHAWLAPRLTQLQRQPAELFSKVDHILIDAWPIYQSYLQKTWKDSVDVGGARVEVPLRSTTNALRDFQDRRTRRLESPLSVTDWARMMLFFAVDHSSGVSNLFKVSSKNPDQVIRVVHKLMILAGVRNVVTHRAAAGAATLEAFRRDYYTTFQDVTSLA